MALFVSRLSPGALTPSRATPGSVGYDLSACSATIVPAKNRALVPTGLAIAVPPNTYGRIAPRSGLALKHGIDVGAGVVDSDYRGEVKVL
jgi:dUTP pyrophosphatase